MFGTARVDLNSIKIDPCAFDFYFALCILTISLVCFGVQEKIVGKNSCFGVSVFRCFAVSWFSNALNILSLQLGKGLLNNYLGSAKLVKHGLH